MSTGTTESAAAPFIFFDLQVIGTERLTPTMLRVTLGGGGMRGFASGGRDQRVKLFLPHPHQDAPRVPAAAGDSWFAAWREMDPAERGIMRSYTVRRQRPGLLEVDFALHGDGGPATRWAAAARPGDRVAVLGPTAADNAGVDFRPPPSADWVLIAGDETALPAIGGILEALPSGLPARAWVEVPCRADADGYDLPAGAEVTWLVRDAGGGLATALPAASFPPGTPYAWLAGEAKTTRTLRRHLVNDRGLDRRAICFTGYWRRGAAEEDLLAEVLAGGTPHTEE
ncbi:siderophore-interacting protein [Actinomadura vinacea]|uniref:Siderophore-interacting protein n=1 Tax=Actinomadura vinacea TaxID=115336 RepID=A0ABP5WFX9_9ACTN